MNPAAMFVYLDEAGDAGFRFTQGSSKFFVVTLLLVDDPIPIQVAVDDLRRELGFPVHTEFKFSHSSDHVKDAFLRTLRRHDFAARALVVDKELIRQPGLRTRESFYQFLVQLVLTHDEGTIQNATLVLDESVKSKRRQLDIGSSLRHALNVDPAAPKVRNIVHHASHTDNLIQAADMVSGAIYRSFSRNDSTYLNIIRSKFQDVWLWGPDTA